MSTRYEYLGTGATSPTIADALVYAYGANVWLAQTFLVGDGEEHYVSSVWIPCCRVGSPGTVTVSIRATDDEAKPTGADLTSGTFDGDVQTSNLAVKDGWAQATFSSTYKLNSGTRYAIVVRALAGDASNKIGWWEDTGAGYTGGIDYDSPDASVTWTTRTYDFLFQEYGDPGTEAALIDKINIFMEDAGVAIWSDVTIGQHLDDALMQVSQKRPQVVKETLATVEDSKVIDMSAVTGLIAGYNDASIRMPKGVEYPVDNDDDERKWRNWEWDDYSIILDISDIPEDDDEDVYAYCLKVHTAATLTPDLERIVIMLTAAKAAISQPLSYLNTFEADTTKFTAITTALGEISDRVAQAIEDLADGRDVGEFEMTGTIDQSIADIVSARTYFNKANIGRPEDEYLNSAIRELSAASSQGSQSGGFRGLSSGELSTVQGYINEARGYLDYTKMRIANINLTNNYEGWGRRMLDQGNAALARLPGLHRSYRRWPRD